MAESSASSSLSSEAADVKPPKVELTETSLSLSTSNLSSVDNEDEKKEIKFRIKREPTPAYRQHAPSPSPFFDPRPEVQFKRREEENFRLEGGRPKINEEEEWRPKQRPLGPNGAAGASNSEAVEDSGVRRSEAPRPDTPEVKEEEEPPLFSPAPMFDEEDEEDEEEEEDGTPVPETGRREPFARGSEREESDGSEWEREKEPERGHSCEGENRGAYEDEEDDTHGAARPALAWITSYSSRMARNSKKKEVPSRPGSFNLFPPSLISRSVTADATLPAEPPPPTAVRPIAAKRPLFKKTGHDSSFLPEDLVPRQDFAVRPLHEAAETADSFLDQFFGFASDVPWTAADKMEITGYREAVQVDDDDDDDEAGDGQAPVLPPPETQAEWVKWWFERELLEINQWDQIEMPTCVIPTSIFVI